MTTEELLRPRYLVINLWPFYCPYKIDHVIHKADNLEGKQFFDTVHLYPHLFRPLEWWEMRTEDDMPKYVKIIHTGNIVKVVDNFVGTNKNMFGIANSNGSVLYEYATPSTEQEYLDYIKLKP